MRRRSVVILSPELVTIIDSRVVVRILRNGLHGYDTVMEPGTQVVGTGDNSRRVTESQLDSMVEAE